MFRVPLFFKSNHDENRIHFPFDPGGEYTTGREKRRGEREKRRGKREKMRGKREKRRGKREKGKGKREKNTLKR